MKNILIFNLILTLMAANWGITLDKMPSRFTMREEMTEKTYIAETLHPGLDLKDDLFMVSFQGTKITVNEDTKLFSAMPTIFIVKGNYMGKSVELLERAFPLNSNEPTILKINDNYYIFEASRTPEIGNRWGLDKIKAFEEDKSLAGDVFKMTKGFLREYIELSNDAQYGLMASWCIGTYLFPVFNAYPYLFIFGPKQTGKSQALDCMELICFNGHKLQNITRAALGYVVDTHRATLLFDQAESIQPHLVSVLADSYKMGGGKRWVSNRTKGNWGPKELSSYSPKAFAAIDELNSDLIDRCCLVKMRRTGQTIPSPIGVEAQAEVIRDLMYRFAILRYSNVQREYKAIAADGTRQGELWRPMGGLLKALNADEDEISQIHDAFHHGTSETKNKLSDEEEALFQVMYDEVVVRETLEVTNKNFRVGMEAMLVDSKKIDAGSVGKKLRQFDLYSSKRRENIGSKKDMVYTFEVDKVLDAIERYQPNLQTEETEQTA